MPQTEKAQPSRSIREAIQVFSECLRKEGKKMTRQRELVVESFLKGGGHVRTEELYERVRERDAKVGFTTVFRTLKALADCGLAREIVLHDGHTRFEYDYKRPHHHHIVCVECDRTIEFFSPESERIQNEITTRYGFKPVRHNLQIFGICPDCQGKEKTSAELLDSGLVFARDALKIAMATERRGIDFYSAASETVTHRSTKETFLKMLGEEQEHLSRLEKEWNQLVKRHKKIQEAPVFLHFDYDALKQIFPSRSEAKKKLSRNLGELEALQMAMKMEKEAGQFFARYAKEFNDTKGRDIFLEFAAEEEEHYDLIKEEYDRLLADA